MKNLPSKLLSFVLALSMLLSSTSAQVYGQEELSEPSAAAPAEEPTEEESSEEEASEEEAS